MTQDHPTWTPWGWAIDRKRLTWLIVNWCFRNRKCFTCRFCAEYRRARRGVFPILRRMQNIGYKMGENNRMPGWYAARGRLDYYALRFAESRERRVGAGEVVVRKRTLFYEH